MEETPRVKTFKFRLENSITYKPGQFVSISKDLEVLKSYAKELFERHELTEGGYNEALKRLDRKWRHYSIASPATEDSMLEITVERHEEALGNNKYKGIFSNYMSEKAKIGEQFEIGEIEKGEHFVYDENSKMDYLGIVAGSGIVPIMCHLRYILDKGLDRKVTVLYSTRGSPKNIIYRKELEEMAKSHSNVKIVHTITGNEDPSWTGYKERISVEMIRREVPDLAERVAFICGGPEFCKAMKKLAEAYVDEVSSDATIKERKKNIKLDVW